VSTSRTGLRVGNHCKRGDYKSPLRHGKTIGVPAGGAIDTESFARNGYYKRPDFIELAKRFGMAEKRALQSLDFFARQRNAVVDSVGRSLLSDDAKEANLALFEDRCKAIRD
jgi:hypothetical protein